MFNGIRGSPRKESDCSIKLRQFVVMKKF